MITSASPLHLVVVRLVDLLAEDEDDEVGVLLDRARFAQVGEDRPLVLARLDRARELREGDDRDRELLGQRLQAREICEISCWRLSARAEPLGELQVVDDRAAPSPCRAFSRRALARISIRPIAGVSSMKIGASLRCAAASVSLGHSLSLAGSRCAAAARARAPASRGSAARAAPGTSRGRRSPTGSFFLIADVLGDVQHQARLAHRGTAGDDDQVRLLEPGGHAVQVLVAGGDAGDGALVLVELLDHLEGRS